MVKHKSSNACASNVHVPPIGLWNTTQVVAFPNDRKYTQKYQLCCGVTNELTLYNHNCFKFCNTESNQTDVLSCIHEAGATKAAAYNNSDGGQTSGADAGFAAASNVMSKSAVGLAVMMVISMAVGTL